MHRHAYTGRKLSLKRDQRRALLRGLVTALFLHEQIDTTLARGKEIVPLAEKLITKAKRGSLHDLRQIKSELLTEKASQKLVVELVPQWQDRTSGHIRLIKTGFRQGDNAPTVRVALILAAKPAKSEKVAAESKAEPVEPAEPKKTTARKPRQTQTVGSKK